MAGHFTFVEGSIAHPTGPEFNVQVDFRPTCLPFPPRCCSSPYVTLGLVYPAELVTSQ